MPTTPQIYKQIRKQAQDASQNSSRSIIGNINYLSRMKPYQIQNRQTQFKDQNRDTLPMILENYSRVLQSNGNLQTMKAYSNAIANYRQAFKPILTNQQNSDIIQNLKYGQQKITQDSFLQRQLIQQARADQQIMRDQRRGQQIQNITIIPANGSSVKSKPFLTIQEQILPIQPILSMKVPVTDSNNVPSAVKLLDKYAVSLNYLPMGSVSEAPGRSYIGRKVVKQGQQQYIFPFPKNNVPSSKTPDIINNFRYYANKTINSWNNYVQNQAKLVQFVSKTSTPIDRKNYIEQKVAGMNSATFCAQALSSINYYYLQIPLQIFVRHKIDKYDGTAESFFKNYEVAPQVSKNPFLLKTQDGKQLCKLLFPKSPTTPVQLVDGTSGIIPFLKKVSNALNKPKMAQFQQYMTKRVSQAEQYFSNTGVSPQQFAPTLNSPYIVGVKKRKFILPSIFTNSQIVQILQKVKQKQNKQKQSIYWDQKWGDQSIMCHDYVWQYNA